MSVEWVRVGDVMSLSREPVEIDPDAAYRRIGIYSWAKGFIHREASPGSEMGSLRYFTFPSSAIVISNIQAWEGAVALSSPSEAGFVASNRFLPYAPSKALDPRFAFHYFASPLGLTILQKSSPGSTVRNRTLSRRLFEDARIPLPDLPEQQRIAARLDAVSAAAISLSAQRHDVASIRDRLLATTTLDAPQVNIGTHVTRRIDSETVAPERSYRMLGLLNRGRGLFEREVMKGVNTSYSRLTELHVGDLVYSKLFGWEGSVAIADRGGFVSHEFPTYTLDGSSLLASYLHHVIRSEHFVRQLSQGTTGMGQRRQRVPPTTFEASTIPLPPLPEQLRIAALLDRLDEVERLAAHRAQLAAALLPAARNEEFSRLLADAPDR